LSRCQVCTETTSSVAMYPSSFGGAVGSSRRGCASAIQIENPLIVMVAAVAWAMASGRIAAPDDERVVEQAALLEVHDHAAEAWSTSLALIAMSALMRLCCPVAMESWMKRTPRLGQTSGEQAVRAERAILPSTP